MTISSTDYTEQDHDSSDHDIASEGSEEDSEIADSLHQEDGDKTTKTSEKNRRLKGLAKELTPEALERYHKEQANTGLVYISRVPPYMKPQKIRHLLSKYGEIGRIYLAPEDEHTRKRRKKAGGNRKLRYTEGWVEFKDKKVAKSVAEALNTQPIGDSKFYKYDLWTLKYLPKFKWHHLTERIAYERASRQQKMQAELEQARRENRAYLQNVDRAKALEAIRERKRQRNEVDENLVRARRNRHQKPVLASEVTDERQTSVQDKVDPGVKSVLAKLF
jgi:ESF2/ABP1 family protein